MKKSNTETIRKVGLRVTPARVLVLNLFSNICQPLNAEEIFRKAKNKKINLVTIYRTLASLEKEKIIRRVDLRKDSVYYELAGNHHHHITCTSCDMSEDFEICGVDSISKNILKKSLKFNSISEHSLEFFGLCKSCARG